MFSFLEEYGKEPAGNDNLINESEENEKRLNRLKENVIYAQQIAHIGSWTYDIKSGEFFFTGEVYNILERNPQEFNGKLENYYLFVHPDDLEKVRAVTQEALTGKEYDIEYRIITPDSQVKYIHEKTKALFDEYECPIKMIGIIQDITEKKQLIEQVKKEKEEILRMQRKFQALIQESSDVFEILAPDGTILYISEASEKVIGYKAHERIGKKIYDYYKGNELQKIVSMINSVLCNPDKIIQEDVILTNKEGKEVYLEVHLQNLLHDPAIEGIVVNFRDITRRVEAEKKMEYISTHDELTGLPNRILLKKELDLQLQYAEETNTSFAFMLLEIDGYKHVIHALEYEFSDIMISQVAKRLKLFFDKYKFLCRYSENQLGIIVQHLNSIEDYEIIAKEIIELLKQPFMVNEYEIDVAAYMGVSIFCEDSKDTGLLIKYAEIALSWVKKEDKNKYKFYSPEISIQNYKQFQLRNDIRKALERNQFKIYYQPQVNLETNEIIAAEALIRWLHPEWGIIMPNEFIYLAEETGFIIHMGKWALREVCRNYKKWLKSGLPEIKISVNFSSIQFMESKFVENTINIIEEFELRPGFLIIEITESILIENDEKAISNIKKLQSFGIQIALDDFGTGFSPLTYLNSFNIDYLKISGIFTKNILQNETSNIITRSIVSMANELKIKLVAEGLEEWKQLDFLRDLNCYSGQGYIYSRPIPSEDFEKLLTEKKCKPLTANNYSRITREYRRNFFRIEFTELLQADITILEIKGKKVNVGNTKVSIKNIGPGGLCFISNIKLPVLRDVILQFNTQLMGKELRVQGCIVWMAEKEDNLYEYGVEFTINESERLTLLQELNKLNNKMMIKGI